MFRIALLLLIALGLSSCGERGPSIEGKWGWFEAAACEGDLDTIEFTPHGFFHRRQGEIFVEGQDVAYQNSSDGGAPRVTAIYVVVNENNSRTISLTFEPQGTDVLIFRGSTIDGVAPEAAGRAMGRELYRCE